jgi:glucose/arabinose dehydrogenase
MLAIAGCSSASSAGSPRPDAGTGPGAASTATGPAVGLAVVAVGLEQPWGLAFLPDGSALVAERDSGRIVRVGRAGTTPTEVMRIPGVHHDTGGESGLLGLAVSPTYATDHLVYAYYTTGTDNRIVRFTLGGRIQPILTGLAHAIFHDGGRIAFGPDGMLYAGVGDARNTANAQNLASLNGKILRMRPDGSVPPGNPFPGSLVYSFGHRNVQGLAWDAAGHLWATEFGQNRFDEVNLILPGHDYGWPLVEGHGPTDGGRFTNPVVTWTTDQASPSGAAIIDDVLYVGALRGERLWRVPLHGTTAGKPAALYTGVYGRIRTVAAKPGGGLWIATSNTDGRGAPKPGDDRIIQIAP